MAIVVYMATSRTREDSIKEMLHTSCNTDVHYSITICSGREKANDMIGKALNTAAGKENEISPYE